MNKKRTYTIEFTVIDAKNGNFLYEHYQDQVESESLPSAFKSLKDKMLCRFPNKKLCVVYHDYTVSEE